MEMKQNKIQAILSRAPVVPVLVVDDASRAVDMAKALVAGGLPAIEITLRTPAALAAIEAVASRVADAIPGVGTVLSAKDLEAASHAGAQFAVSPGATPDLLAAALTSDLALLPGAATASEAMALFEAGYGFQKFFPAEAAGGAPFLKSLASPLPGIRFCPTGGITETNAPDYLKLDNVVCVGGSWVVPGELIARADWAGIESLARRASTLSQDRP